MGLRLADIKFIEDGNIFAFDAYFSNSEVEILETSYPIGSIVTEFLNYDETEYVLAANRIEECFKQDDEEGFINYFEKCNEIIKEMPIYKFKLQKVIIQGVLVNLKTEFPQIDETVVIEYNRPIMEKIIKKYLNLRDDLLYIKHTYIHLLEEMEKQMQTVTASQKYEKAIQVPLLADYLEADGLQAPFSTGLARSYIKFIIRESLVTGELEIFERRIFNRLLDFIYIEFCKALMKQNLPKKCKNCGLYFLLENGFKNEYCTRPLSTNPKKTCRDVGAAQSFKAKVSQSPEWKIHQRAYKKYYARMKKGQITQEAFEEWTANAEHLRSETLVGNISIEVYEKLLNNL